jgi:hypothetical protein
MSAQFAELRGGHETASIDQHALKGFAKPQELCAPQARE